MVVVGIVVINVGVSAAAAAAAAAATSRTVTSPLRKVTPKANHSWELFAKPRATLSRRVGGMAANVYSAYAARKSANLLSTSFVHEIIFSESGSNNNSVSGSYANSIRIDSRDSSGDNSSKSVAAVALAARRRQSWFQKHGSIDQRRQSSVRSSPTGLISPTNSNRNRPRLRTNSDESNEVVDFHTSESPQLQHLDQKDIFNKADFNFYNLSIKF